MPPENQDNQGNPDPVEKQDLYQMYDEMESADNDENQLDAPTQDKDDVNLDNSEESENADDTNDQGDSGQFDDDLLKAPEHWPDDKKELFNKQPEEVQGYLLERHKEMEADYTRKSQARASDIKLAEGLHSALDPYRQDFESQGVDEVGAVKALLEAHAKLKANPAEGLMWLAQQYGYNPQLPEVDNSGYDSQDEDGAYIDPDIQALKNELASMKGELNKYQAQQQGNAQQNYYTSLSDFVNAKDDEGNEQNPLAGEVRKDITRLMQVGVAKDFPTAYKMAIAGNSEIQEKLSEHQNQTAKQIAEKKRLEAVSKAKKAAKGVKSSSTQNTVNTGKKKTLRQDLYDIWDDLESQSV